jgi:hypothetical protein
MKVALIGMLVFAALGCGGSSRLRCGEGTEERNGVCVLPIGPSGASSGTGGVGAGGSGASGGTGNSGGDGAAGGGDMPSTPPVSTTEEVERAEAYCSTFEGGVVEVTTKAELESRLVGRWLYCAGEVVFGRADTAGIRLDSDGTFRFLLHGNDGEVVDGQGFDNMGRYAVLDTSSVNGPGSFQLDLELTGIGGSAVFPVFATDPPKMRFSHMVGHTDYASLEE